jgi:hypothetical protein
VKYNGVVIAIKIMQENKTNFVLLINNNFFLYLSKKNKTKIIKKMAKNST